jgi:hypothetical protein
MNEQTAVLPPEDIERLILVVRGQKVLLDADLARLYGVTTKRLNEQVKRNRDRFPERFLFQLAADEKSEVVAICDHLKKLRFSPVLPYAFTEHGAIMAATVLNSPRAIQMSIYVVEAFVRLRELLALNRELAQTFAELERRVVTHDGQIQALFEAIRQLMTPTEEPRRQIGFHMKDEAVTYRVRRRSLPGRR